MKRLTTDNPKDNIEAALNLFYIKDHETWVRGGGPGPEYADVSLFDYTRQLIKAHIPDVDLDMDDDDLSTMMAECLFDWTESLEGVFALLYTAAWAYAELRHRLAAYEDTGIEPEQVMELKSFIQGGIHKVDDGWKHVQELLQAEQAGRLVVLNEPMRPLVWGDKERDTVLCPRCLCDLMGGFEFAPSSETMMFQCPHCGQPIASDKAITMEEAEAALQKGGTHEADFV